MIHIKHHSSNACEQLDKLYGFGPTECGLFSFFYYRVIAVIALWMLTTQHQREENEESLDLNGEKLIMRDKI